MPLALSQAWFVAEADETEHLDLALPLDRDEPERLAPAEVARPLRQASLLMVIRPGTPWLSIREALFTVSPQRSNRYCRWPITPAMTRPKWIPTRMFPPSSAALGPPRSNPRPHRTQFKTGFSTYLEQAAGGHEGVARWS